MSERKTKSSKIDAPAPTMPGVAWDFNERSAPGQVKRSEPNIMIWPYGGRSWESRGVQNTSRDVMPRRQQFKTKPPNGNGSC